MAWIWQNGGVMNNRSRAFFALASMVLVSAVGCLGRVEETSALEDPRVDSVTGMEVGSWHRASPSSMRRMAKRCPLGSEASRSSASVPRARPRSPFARGAARRVGCIRRGHLEFNEVEPKENLRRLDRDLLVSREERAVHRRQHEQRQQRRRQDAANDDSRQWALHFGARSRRERHGQKP